MNIQIKITNESNAKELNININSRLEIDLEDYVFCCVKGRLQAAGTNTLWCSAEASAKYRDLTWRQEGIAGRGLGWWTGLGVMPQVVWRARINKLEAT